MKKYLLLSTVVFASIFFLSHTPSAQAVTVSPLRLELSASPGDTVSAQFKLYNEENKTNVYYFSTANFDAKDESGQPQFTTDTQGLASWVQRPTNLTLQPKSYQVVDFSITVPRDAEPGGYFSAVLASTLAPETGESQSVSLANQVGVLLLFRVNGDVAEGADVLEFDTAKKQHFFTALPVQFYYRFQNGGDVWLKPLGDIIISNIFGSTTKIIKANSTGGDVLPKSIRRFQAAWLESGGNIEQDPLLITSPISPKGFWATVNYQWKNFVFGRYTANLNLVYGTDVKQGITKKIAFWVFPWQLLLVEIISFILVSGIFLALAIWIVVSFLKRRKRLNK